MKYKVGDKLLPKTWNKCGSVRNAPEEHGAVYIEVLRTDNAGYIYVAKNAQGESVEVRRGYEDGRSCEYCYGDNDLEPYTPPAKFKVGDQVKILEVPGVGKGDPVVGKVGFVSRTVGNSTYEVEIGGKNTAFLYNDESLELVEVLKMKAYVDNIVNFKGSLLVGETTNAIKQTTFMSSVKNFIKDITRSAEDKALIKAEMVDSCGDLTSYGKEAFVAYLLNKEKAAFVAEVVTPFLEEQKASK